ncbi:MAG: leucine--tRNA ligase [Bdellovibrionales bacterium]
MSYPHNEIDKKWQAAWEQAGCFRATESTSKPKYYALDMFPYPSGAGLHVGHLASYTPTDIVSRFKRAKGFQVLHPMGYDAFGLPAEQYAIQTGVHPAETTEKAISNFRRQLKSFGYSFDWSRELSTCEPSYYKWTQFIFLKLFEKGLAYQSEVPVNWCPALRTVLANDEVVDGKSERGGHPVVRVPMKQWMLKITDYAERLLEGLDRVDWPERSKEGQRNWIGKSEGASVKFAVEGFADQLEIFTTRPDTIFGVTFMVLAPEHPLVKKLTSHAQKASVEAYVDKASRKSEVDRKADTEKSGVFTGGYALNPLLDAKDPKARIPIWIADYVMMDYGTGAIMAVPGHDSRDFEFATKFKLPILRVLAGEGELPFEGDGKLMNSAFLDGLSKQDAIAKAIATLEAKKLGTKQVQYKLRDWLFSRQRYWGEPFPMVVMEKTGLRGVSYDELPVALPAVADYQPTEKGEPPLARVAEFVNYTDPKTGEKGRRITDTMPGSAGSSWYFLRYTDPHNDKAPFSFEAQKYWMPIDLYVGGPEHTVGHLLYARFWQKVLFDVGLVSHDEPIKKLAHQGDITGPDGFRMSKSRGNTINPDDVREEYGADAARMYISFLGPFDKSKPWSTTGIAGVHRFLDRVWRQVVDPDGKTLPLNNDPIPEPLNKLLHKTIKKVGEDLESLSFNTAISALMILLNEINGSSVKPVALLKPFMQLLAPLAPHIAEELWQRLGGEGFVAVAPWPAFDAALVTDDVISMGVQVNGKTRGTIELSPTASEDVALELARAQNSVKNAIDGKKVAKVIYKAGKILNIIVQ